VLNSIAVPIKKPRKARTVRAGEAGAQTAPALDTRPSMPVLPHPAHRYGIGERLRLANGGRVLSRPQGYCTVVARMPYEGYGALQYRVRSEAEQFERIVPEADLSDIPAD
jgi:hypothetical protein